MPADKKESGSRQVADFMIKLDHPLKNEIEEVRAIVASADPRLGEHIKWNAPSFFLGEEDRITFNLKGKGFFRLVFHCGAKAKAREGKQPLFEDTTGLLEWAAPDRAVVKLTDRNDVREKEDKLRRLVAKWLEATES
ncbi:DUF1801 domain-containing protein [Paenibacillus flagellatus]|uniref:DUF1801 domain-containing protein n=1 Tax=Paenibacillus flagellatus TaxID=2211139 RepID=A0A2V5K608_9BACL|nr:DUF1801 domain-containing protein [Paenibacillus flagellatus]PYI53334.1 DUF1801 domain-containing protein [Paenibacillus flagellatus]